MRMSRGAREGRGSGAAGRQHRDDSNNSFVAMPVARCQARMRFIGRLSRYSTLTRAFIFSKVFSPMPGTFFTSSMAA